MRPIDPGERLPTSHGPGSKGRGAFAIKAGLSVQGPTYSACYGPKRFQPADRVRFM